MKDSSWTTYAKILLGLLVPFTIIFYGLILPSAENKYSDGYDNSYFEDSRGNKTEGNKGKQTKKQDKEQEIIERKDASTFSKYMTRDEMVALEGALKKIDSGRISDPQQIASIFLESMGYPANLITVEYLPPSNTGFEGDIQAGFFMPATGKLSLNSTFIKYVQRGSVIGVIRHELDHFDKFTKLCKSIGVDNFQKLFGGNINRSFWENAILYTDTRGFDKKKFLKAVTNMNEYTDITSFYQLFVQKSNDVRNPFELTAYSFSDYVDAHYKIKGTSETNVKKVAKVFNQVDWQIYKIANNNKALSRSRSAIFDYYFLRAMITYNPNVKTAYQNAVKNNSMTQFWSECEKVADGLRTNALSIDQTNKIIKILNSMNLAMNETITNKQINSILQLKYMTLKDALRSPKYSRFQGNIMILLSVNVNDYLDFINTYSSDNDNMKLKLLATKYWLSTVKIKKEDGSFYDFTRGDTPDKIERKIKSEKAFKEAQKTSGLDANKYFENFIMKNKIY